ncbi:MAG: NYN domain-containing protein [Thermoplasmata archaeon]
MERAAVFIDGGYLDTVLITCGKLRIDYAAFSDVVCKGYERFRTYYYHSMPYQSPTPTDEESRRFSGMHRFVTTLRRLPRFEIRLGRIVKHGEGPPHQKQVDTLLAIDLTRLSTKGHISKAILVAGDADHVPAVEVAKEEGVLVEVYYLPRDSKGNRTLSQELHDLCDDRVPLTKDFLSVFER